MKRVLVLALLSLFILGGCWDDPPDSGSPPPDRPPYTPPPAPADIGSPVAVNASADRLVFGSSNGGTRDAEIYTSYRDGSGRARVTRNLDWDGLPIVHPVNKRIYFVCGDETDQICSSRTDGRDRERFFATVYLHAEDYSPGITHFSISPDGSRMLITVYTVVTVVPGEEYNTDYDLYLVDLTSGQATGEDVTEVSVGLRQSDRDAAWVDNNQIVWSRATDGDYELMTFNLNSAPGSAAKRLTDDDLDDLNVDVSSDGTQLAWISQSPEDQFTQAAVVNRMPFVASGGGTPEAVALIRGPLGMGGDPDVAWSPQGDAIAYESLPLDETENDVEIFTVSVPGGAPVNITNNDSYDIDPEWEILPTNVSVGSPLVYTEGGPGGVTFPIELDAPQDEPVIVSYATEFGTAGAADFAASTGWVRFEPGERLKFVTIQVTDDTIVEPAETFKFVLSNPTAGVFLGRSESRGLIMDDEDEPTPTPSSPSPSPSTSTPAPTLSGRIAFISEANGYHQLFTMDPDGSDVEHVSTNQASSNLGDPSWSSNGTKIIHTALDGSQHELITRTAVPNGAFDPILHPSDDVEPAFRGGTTTEYWWSSNEHGDYDLFRGPGRNHMTTSASDERDVSFGNDPLKFVYEANYDGDYDIYLQALSESGANLSGAPVNLTQETGAAFADTDPDMSADGTKVVFSSNRTGGGDIYVVDVATKAVTRITSDPAAETQPTFSPNGTQIAFVREVGGDTEIFRINAQAGSTAVNISNNPGGPDISPDWGAAPSSPRPVPTGSTALSVVVPLGLTFGVGLQRARRRRFR